MKRFINIGLSIIGILGILAIGGIIVASKPLPKGIEGEKAEELTDKMLASVNLPAWESIRYLSFKFRGNHTYVWDRWYDLVEVCHSDMRILINLKTLEGKAWDGGRRLEGEEKREAIQKGWEKWCNDSFWLNPFVKVRDKGVIRSHVELDSGNDGLLVTFSQGGVTPGDSFMFELDETGLPISWRMWVSVLPIKGLKFDIEKWVLVDGALIATRHRILSFGVGVEDVKSGDHHSEIGLEYDPFTDF